MEACPPRLTHVLDPGHVVEHNLVDKREMMNTTLEEEAKMKAHALHVQVIGWAENRSPQEDEKLRHQIFHLLQHGGWEEMNLELKPVLSTLWIWKRKKHSYLKKGHSRVRK